MVGMAHAAENAKKCFTFVDILSNGKVGRVSTVVSSRANEIEGLVGQLVAKYGKPSVGKQNWTYGSETMVLKWSLPDISIVYEERGETRGGTAFNGGNLEQVYTGMGESPRRRGASE